MVDEAGSSIAPCLVLQNYKTSPGREIREIRESTPLVPVSPAATPDRVNAHLLTQKVLQFFQRITREN